MTKKTHHTRLLNHYIAPLPTIEPIQLEPAHLRRRRLRKYVTMLKAAESIGGYAFNELYEVPIPADQDFAVRLHGSGKPETPVLFIQRGNTISAYSDRPIRIERLGTNDDRYARWAQANATPPLPEKSKKKKSTRA